MTTIESLGKKDGNALTIVNSAASAPSIVTLLIFNGHGPIRRKVSRAKAQIEIESFEKSAVGTILIGAFTTRAESCIL
jgi:hypothetical protein